MNARSDLGRRKPNPEEGRRERVGRIGPILAAATLESLVETIEEIAEVSELALIQQTGPLGGAPRIFRPEWYGLASEINTLADLGDPALYVWDSIRARPLAP